MDNFKEVREDMDDGWDEKDYEKFVLTLLNRAKKGASSKKVARDSIKTPITSENKPTLTPIRKSKHANPSKTQPSSSKHTETRAENNLSSNRMIDAFYRGVKEFPIEIFIECNPTDSLSQSALCDAVSFWGKMDCQQKQENDPDKATEIYCHIIDFLGELEKYIGFLRSHSINPEAFPDGFQLENCDCGALDGEISCSQQRLKSLFQIAASETEVEVSSRLKAHLNAQKKAGKYEHLETK